VTKIDIAAAPISSGSNYPERLAGPCLNKLRRRLSRAAELKEIAVNLLELQPGAWSSQRHWHTRAEEQAISARTVRAISQAARTRSRSKVSP